MAEYEKEIVDPFIEATRKVFQATCQMRIEDDGIETVEDSHITGDISAVCAITCPTLRGSFAIAFEWGAFKKAVERMIGDSGDDLTSEHTSAAGEICNQIFGQAKIALNDAYDLQIKKSLPHVVSGDSHELINQIEAPGTVAKFKTKHGKFSSEVAYVKGNFGES